MPAQRTLGGVVDADVLAPSVVDAHNAARQAAERAGLRIRELTEMADMVAAASLLRRIWRSSEADQPINAATMRALSHTDNYVSAGFVGDRMVGVVVGFRAGRTGLHSHIAGVDAQHAGRGMGLALKLHQRAWALDRGLDQICWTFDPLVRRNAHFNLNRLGALPVEYLVDFYGDMPDGINAGVPTDRLEVQWDLATGYPVPSRADLSATTVLRRGERGEPVVVTEVSGPRMRVALPDDIEALRASDPRTAQAWRLAVREVLTEALTAGYRITGMSGADHYLLEVQV